MTISSVVHCGVTRKSTAAAVALIALCSGVLSGREAAAAGAGLLVRGSHHGPWATGTPIGPPPSDLLPLVPRFLVLYQSYVALDGPAKLPFAAWVVANGLTDPRMVEAFVLLYEWYERAISLRGGA